MKQGLTERKRYPTPLSNRSEKNYDSPASSRPLTANLIVKSLSVTSKEFAALKSHRESLGPSETFPQRPASELSDSFFNESPSKPVRKIKIEKSFTNSPRQGIVVYKTVDNLSSLRVSKGDIMEGIPITKRTTSELDTNLTTKVRIIRAGSAATNNFAGLDMPDVEKKKIQEKIDFIKELSEALQKQTLIDPEITKHTKNVLTHFKISLGKAYDQYLLIPESEKAIVEAIYESELYAIKLLKMIKKRTDRLLEENNALTQKVKETQEEMLALANKKNEALNRYMNSTFVYETNEIKAKLESTVKDTQKAQMVWIVEKQKMLAEIEALNKKILEYQDNRQYENLKKEHEALKERMTTKIRGIESAIEKRNSRIYRLEMQVAGEKGAKELLERQYQDLQTKYSKLTAQYETLQEDYDKLKNSEIKFRESYYMLKEDSRHREMKFAELSETLLHTRRKLFDMQNKLDIVYKDNEQRIGIKATEFEKDSTLLNSIKTVFSTNKHPIIYTHLERFFVNQNEFNMETLNLAKYTYYRPTFHVLVERELEEKMTNPFDEVSMKEKEFIGIIRGIFDSKYNEILYYDSYKMVSSFSDFVYSWLSTYILDKTEMKVKAIGPEDQVDVNRRRLNFYQCLMNTNLGKVWDIKTFRDFLEERYTPDEIYFFLHCRYLLFGGAQLDYLTSSVNLVHWVQLDRGYRLVETVLNKMNPELLKSIKQQIKQRAKLKYEKLYIDSGFLLRVLLDFYRQEKKNKFVAIYNTFMKISTPGKEQRSTVPFDQFKRFMENYYPFSSDLDKAKLYREAWCVGNGNVDVESFFIAATESGFFIEALRNQPFKDLVPVPISINQESEQTEALSTLLTNKYEKLSDFFIKCKKFTRNLGIEPLILDVDSIEGYLMRKHSQDLNKGETFYHALNKLTHIFMKSRNQYFFIHKSTLADQKELIQADLKGFEITLDSVELYARIDQAEMLDKNRKVKKVQTNYRNKMNKWYNLLSLLKDKVKEEKEKSTKQTPKDSPRGSILQTKNAIASPNKGNIATSKPKGNVPSPNKSNFAKNTKDNKSTKK